MAIEIGKIIGLPGRAVSSEWSVAASDDGDPLSLSLSIHAGKTGEMRILVATGPDYPSRLAEKTLVSLAGLINPELLNGTLITAHNFASRINALNNSDKPLYPGWPDGSFSDRAAFEIFELLLRQVDYALFLEGPQPGMSHIPHAALYSIDDPPTMSCHPELLKMMGHDLILEKEGLKGSLSIEAQRILALPILVAQLDETTEVFETEQWLLEKVLNFLAYTGLLDIKPTIPDRTFIATREYEIRSDRDGDIEMQSSLGEFIPEGDKLGTIQGSSAKDRAEIRNSRDAYIVSHRNPGKVMVDDVICSMLGVTFQHGDENSIMCDTALDNSEMDAHLRPNELFRKSEEE